MQEIILEHFSTSRQTGKESHPFAIYYVYTRNEGNFVVKGMSETVKQYVENRWWGNCFYRYTFWKDGHNRGGWIGCGLSLYFSRGFDSGKSQNHYKIHVYKTVKKVDSNPSEIRKAWLMLTTKQNDKKLTKSVEISVRRIPHRWISFFNEAEVLPKRAAFLPKRAAHSS